MIESIIIYSLATMLAVYYGRKYTINTSLGFAQTNNYKKKIFYSVLSFLPLFFVSALRWNTGTDTYHTYTPEYYGMFWSQNGYLTKAQQGYLYESRNYNIPHDAIIRNIHDIEEYYSFASNHSSVLFKSLERILIYLHADVQWLYVITSAIVLVFVFLAIYRQSVNVPLAIFFFVATNNYFLSINVVAQFIAISLCLFACEYVEKHKPIQFFLIVFIAMGFHASAFVFLPVYFLSRVKIKPKWCIAIIIICLLGSPFFFHLIEWIVRLITPKYARYFGEKSDFELIFYGIGIFVFIVTTYYYEKCKDKPYFRIWYYMNVLGLIALSFSVQIPNIKRINYYYSAPIFLLLPLVVESETDSKRKRILKAGLVSFFILETIVAVFLMNKNEIMPYTGCWQRNLGIVIAKPLL